MKRFAGLLVDSLNLGGVNTSIDNAATNVANRGIPFVASAGDNNADACNYSPGRAAGVLNVGAVTSTGAKAPYSNYGSCVDVYALGTRTGAWLNGTMTRNGTGVAAAYVAGCVAKYVGASPTAMPSTAYSWVIANSQLVGSIRIFTCPI